MNWLHDWRSNLADVETETVKCIDYENWSDTADKDFDGGILTDENSKYD